MDTGRIATRYARAIYEYAAEQKQETSLYEYMEKFIESYLAFPDLKKALANPTVSNEKKTELLLTACGVRDNELLTGIVLMIVKSGRGTYFGNIARVYKNVYRKNKGTVIAHLTTIYPASEKLKTDVIEALNKITGKNIELHSKEDPDIIGGFILEIEDKRLDASVKDQLNQLRLDLTT